MQVEKEKNHTERSGDLLQRRIWGDFMRINEFSGSKLSFSHHTERKRSASYRGWSGRYFIFAKANASAVFALRATPCQVWQGGLWSAPSVHEAILRIMKHACRRMKRSLDRLHVFCPKLGKKMGCKFLFFVPRPYQREFQSLFCK